VDETRLLRMILVRLDWGSFLPAAPAVKFETARLPCYYSRMDPTGSLDPFSFVCLPANEPAERPSQSRILLVYARQQGCREQPKDSLGLQRSMPGTSMTD
jgi:hypothetical protein